jgi:hypothetical protein
MGSKRLWVITRISPQTLTNCLQYFSSFIDTVRILTSMRVRTASSARSDTHDDFVQCCYVLPILILTAWASCCVVAVQLEEELQDDLKWSMLTKSILHVEKSKFQDVELIETGPFGKVRCPALLY